MNITTNTIALKPLELEIYKANLTYVWLDKFNILRSKTKRVEQVNQIPIWNFDGSSTSQMDYSTMNTEVLLQPIRVYIDGFNERNNENYLVLCDTYNINKDGIITPTVDNYRYGAINIFNETNLNPKFGFEQEFYLIDNENHEKLSSLTNISNKDNNYCRTTTKYTYIMNEFYNLCLSCKIGIVGWNAEVAPFQFEYQIFGNGIDACDDLVMSRYVLERYMIDNNYEIKYDPKLYENLSGSGCHINYSDVRSKEYMDKYIKALGETHNDLMKVYGENNNKRLTGLHETSSYSVFTYGVGDRYKSVRIPNSTALGLTNYFEDRRPGANINPYMACGALVKVLSNIK